MGLAVVPSPRPPVVLNLNHCGFGDRGAVAVAEAVRTDSTVRSLWLCGNAIGPRGALRLAHMLAKNRTLETLVLSDNQIGDDGCQALFDVMPQNSSVTELNLGANAISNDGCAAYCSCAAFNRKLRFLFLNHNLITNSGALLMMEQHPTLEWLDLSDNLIGSEGAWTVLDMWRKNSVLRHVGLFRNYFDSNVQACVRACPPTWTPWSYELGTMTSMRCHGGVVGADPLRCMPLPPCLWIS